MVHVTDLSMEERVAKHEREYNTAGSSNNSRGAASIPSSVDQKVKRAHGRTGTYYIVPPLHGAAVDRCGSHSSFSTAFRCSGSSLLAPTPVLQFGHGNGRLSPAVLISSANLKHVLCLWLESENVAEAYSRRGFVPPLLGGNLAALDAITCDGRAAIVDRLGPRQGG